MAKDVKIDVTCDGCGVLKTYTEEGVCFNDGFFYGVNQDVEDIFGDHEILCKICVSQERHKTAWEDQKFPFYDTWGVMDVEVEFPGMHKDKKVDFNIWIDDDGNKWLQLYGYDEEHQQIDTGNIVGSYKLINAEDLK